MFSWTTNVFQFSRKNHILFNSIFQSLSSCPFQLPFLCIFQSLFCRYYVMYCHLVYFSINSLVGFRSCILMHHRHGSLVAFKSRSFVYFILCFVENLSFPLCVFHCLFTCRFSVQLNCVFTLCSHVDCFVSFLALFTWGTAFWFLPSLPPIISRKLNATSVPWSVFLDHVPLFSFSLIFSRKYSHSFLILVPNAFLMSLSPF